MPRYRARLGVERAVDDLGDPMRRCVEHILVGGPACARRTAPVRGGARVCHVRIQSRRLPDECIRVDLSWVIDRPRGSLRIRTGVL